MKVIALVFFSTLYYQAYNAGVARCYHRVNSYDDPLDEEECPQEDGIDYICLSSEALANDEYCKHIDKSSNVSCYTCEEDLCNRKNDINTGAKKCYTSTLVQERCPDIDGTDYVCLSAEMTLNSNTTVIVKGCYPVTVIEDCKKLDDLDLSWCYTCQEDLCNNDANS